MIFQRKIADNEMILSTRTQMMSIESTNYSEDDVEY